MVFVLGVHVPTPAHSGKLLEANQSRLGERGRYAELERGTKPTVFLRMGVGSSSQTVPPLNNSWLAKFYGEILTARHRENIRNFKLRTVHKNPGPGPRGKGKKAN